MDLSKLPRLSKTDVPPGSPTDPEPAPHAAPGGFPVVMPGSPAAGPVPTPVVPAAQLSSFCRQCGAPLRPGARFCDSCGAPATPSQSGYPAPRDSFDAGAGGGAEIWISIAIGAILLLMQPRLIQYLSHRLFGTYFAPFIHPETGDEVPYTTLVVFWSDLGLTLFAIVLLLEGLVLAFTRKRALVMIAFGLTVLTTAYNLAYLVYTFSSGVAILSAMAVAFGVYIAIYEWRLLQQSRPLNR